MYVFFFTSPINYRRILLYKDTMKKIRVDYFEEISSILELHIVYYYTSFSLYKRKLILFTDFLKITLH